MNECIFTQLKSVAIEVIGDMCLEESIPVGIREIDFRVQSHGGKMPSFY
jgi:hypothetical protein